jgi:hypothetical protein
MKGHFSEKGHLEGTGGRGEYPRLKADLLALNTVFEAARVGESGRSLAELAHELKETVTRSPDTDRQG